MTAIDIEIAIHIIMYFALHIRITHKNVFWVNGTNMALCSFFIQIMNFSSVFIKKKLISVKRPFRSAHKNPPFLLYSVRQHL